MSTRPFQIFMLAVAVALAACGAPTRTATSIPADGFDLDDPDLQARLGTAPLDDISWQRTVGQFTVVGRGTVPSPTEVDLIAAVLEDVPKALLDRAPIRHVVRVPDPPDDGRPAHEQTVAFALGPDIFLLDRAFALSEEGSTRHDMTRAIVHELAHVAQWVTMSDAYVAAALDGELAGLDPTVGSTLVADFAAATGWNRVGGDDLNPDWSLAPDRRASTTYGQNSAGEDMAEAVSLVAVGMADHLPDDRRQWVENWLGRPAAELATGRPWAPPGSVQVLSYDPLFDEVAAAAARGPFTHAEPLYFELPSSVPPVDELVDEVTTQLRARNMSGSLERLADDRLPRFGGLFTRSDGLRYWVEVWDFRMREAGTDGPDLPILTYVAIW